MSEYFQNRNIQEDEDLVKTDVVKRDVYSAKIENT